MTSYIFHVDMDAFFASVEELDKPWLKNKPMVVAGKSNRGVVTTANYEARKYGLHSAMPMFQARKLCPQVISVPVDKDKYSQYSKEIFLILKRFTPIIEKVSLDEAYMEFNFLTDPLIMANSIKEEVYKETGLSLSIGISYNKFLAKLASDWEKPNGITHIKKEMIPDILLPLSISKVHGLGKRSIARLDNIGIETIADLYMLKEEFLIDYFGVHGSEIYHRIRGIDNRKVEAYQERKSLGMENTFSTDISNLDDLSSILLDYSQELSEDLIKKGLLAKTFTVKLKDSNFNSKSKSSSLSEFTDDFKTISSLSQNLLESLFSNNQYRLLGLTASNLVEASFRQLSLF